MARRSGWERAYLDYETLKMLLSQIEAVYEEEGHRDADSSVTSTHKRGDYRDELFLEGDSDVAFASSNGSDDSDDDDKINNNNDRNRRYPLTFTSHESTDEDDDQEQKGRDSKCMGWKNEKPSKTAASAAIAHAKKKKQNQLLLPRREEASDYFIGTQQAFLVDESHDGEDTHADESSMLNTSMQYSGGNEHTLLLGQTQQSSYYSGFNNNHGPGTPPRNYWYDTNFNANMQPQLLIPLPTTASKSPKDQKRNNARRRRRKRRDVAVPPHLRVAHSKARAITERFLGLLRADVEKVTLFAQSRLGELADTAGSLRFPSQEDFGSSRGAPELCGMHPSASSSDGSSSDGSSTQDDITAANEAELSPISRKTFSGGGSVVTMDRNTTGSKNETRVSSKQKRLTKKVVPRPAFAAVERQIQNFANLRRSRPTFQRMDHIVGEDLLLLSAVDEADGYTAVGVELMHVLRYICVNVIAIRKICRKHDRLLMNRMLGGYYHRKRKKSGKKSITNVTLGGIVSLSLGDDCADEPAVVNGCKLVGVYDLKIQLLANSTTVQVISSCIALALSEYEVSHSRADALAKLNSQKRTSLRTGVDKEEDDENSFTCTPGTSAFGLSPSRWRMTKSQFVAEDLEAPDAQSFDSVDENCNGPPSSASTVSLTRLRFTVVSIFGLREVARWKTDPYTNFLSRASLVFTGPNVVGEGLDGCSREILDFFVAYNPDAALLLDSNALYKGLLEGQWRELPIGSVMLTTLAMAITGAPLSGDDFHDKASDLIAAVSVQPNHCDFKRMEYIQRNCATYHEIDPFVKTRSLDDTMLIINRMSVFLYAANYYIAHSTSNLFVIRTGAHPAHAATIIGAASFGALIAAFFHARGISIQNEGISLTSMSLDFFRKCFLFAAFYPIVGNILHALAVSWKSIPLAVFARMWIGFGSIELLNRQLLTSHLRTTQVVPESAKVVVTQIYGVVFGLLLGSFLALFDLEVSPFGQFVTTISSLHTGSYFMAILWAVYWLFVYFQFHRASNGTAVSDGSVDMRPMDLPHDDALDSDSSDDNAGTPQSMVYSETNTETVTTSAQNIQAMYNKKLKVTLPIDNPLAFDTHRELKGGTPRDSVAKRKSIRQWKSLLGRLGRVLTYNVAIPVTLAGVVFCRLTHELLFTSCATITSRYFAWNGSQAGLFLGLISGTCLPIKYFCGRIAGTFDERTIIKNSLVITILGFFIMINWAAMVSVVSHISHIFDEDAHGTYHPYDWDFGVYQYLIGIIVSFFGVVSLEGAALSLMSKVSPTRPRFMGCGTFVTFASLMARIFGNIHIVIVGLSHQLINTDIINSVVLPLVAACIVAIYIVKKHFFFLI